MNSGEYNVVRNLTRRIIRTDGLATGIKLLDMDCATTEEGGESCTPTSGSTPDFATEGGPSPQEPGSDCTGNAESYQSWQLEGWARKYELPPGSSSSDPPTSDTGPTFVIRNMRNRADVDIFACSSSGDAEDDKFTGNCTAADERAASTAKFTFDRQLNLLTITQHWECGDA